MNSLWQDLRYGARMLLKTPAVTLVAVIALTLGIGANTALFSVVNAVLLRSLPYPDGDRLAIVWEHRRSGTGNPQNVINLGNFYDWKEQNRGLWIWPPSLISTSISRVMVNRKKWRAR